VNKNQGIPVHPDREQSQQTLIDLVREYLQEKSEYPSNNAHFQPALCHRLDRNTGGLVIIAKNQACLSIMLDKLEAREIKKYYQCLVKGRMEKPEAQLKAFLWKDSSKSRVFVSEHKTAGSLEIITKYKVVEYNPSMDVSRLEVELVTGRTHQIRAHLAFIGHPVLGDGKYGTNAINRSFGLKQQALWACRIKFAFTKSGSLLNYLNGKEFSVEPGFNITLS
jgi:23S rRNA pseudouridine955/2504/2580 synthase